MKTSINNNHLDTASGEEAERILRNCVHCGFCNATCPTYLLRGDELDGPRGRIYLIKNMLEGHTPTAKTQLHLDRCLTCRNCETTCPSGVEYGKLLDIGRKLTTKEVERPANQRLFRFSLRKWLLSPRLFVFALRLGQTFRPVLPPHFRKRVPPRINKSHSWPSTHHVRKILLVEGCVQTALQPDIDTAAAIVFDKIGIQSLRIKASGCCGAISHHLDAQKEALAYIKGNIDAWWPAIESGSIEAISMTASGCGVMIKDYAHLLADDPDYAAKAKTISALYRDPCEIITAEVIAAGSISTRFSGKRIAFHPPCTLQHGLKLDGKTEALLISLGYELVEFSDKHLGCGSAGTYSITQKGLSSQLRDNKLTTIDSAQAELIV